MIFRRTSEVRNFYEVLKSSHYQFKIFGLCCFKTYDPKNMRPTSVGILMIFVWSAFYCYTFLVNIISPYELETFNSLIYFIGCTVSDLLCAATQAVLPWINFYQRKYLRQVVDTVHSVDLKVILFNLYALIIINYTYF